MFIILPYGETSRRIIFLDSEVYQLELESISELSSKNWKGENGHLIPTDPDVRIGSTTDSGKVMTDKLAKANCFNDYFKSMFSKSGSYGCLPIPADEIENVMPPVMITAEEITRRLDSLLAEKAGGLDEISSKVLRACSVWCRNTYA